MTISPASSASELRERIGANLALVRQRIATTGRDVNSVRVVAVTKTFSRDEVRAAFEVGLRDFGENYVDELCVKRDAVPEGVWHYLGALQSNKIARATQCASVLSGVSRERELTKLASLASTVSLDIQVDFTQRPERNGAPASQVPELVSRARELNLKVRGLMVVAPREPAAAREAFRRTVQLADELGLGERSMGMSEDLEMACELGTTEVRVGRALFGPRDTASRLA
jgi:PLP dependent protein